MAVSNPGTSQPPTNNTGEGAEARGGGVDCILGTMKKLIAQKQTLLS